ncbi:GrpB family protein [Halorubrum sp. Atlit-8R]|uniref:GrpB family protein n=1 Tax=unclassified Halorubrum TaxID=2642239 RepID=UPI000EF241B8|nr:MULTISPECIES: GrpB family protein [unclassified Halorubrum]RLM70641.1 GrpB family protein [Halorubrum sp. Atlit-9R]RLM83204.1 GrpB family protein [Halorubrum sp. Atlit-8R]
MDPKEDGVTLDPDPRWEDRYEAVRERVESASDDRLLDVFHVGSTAIPGVPGKPVLDVMPVYADADGMRAAAEWLAAAGFEREHDADDTVVAIRREADGVVAVRMHTVEADQWRPMLLFREYLSDHPRARAEYARVKRDAAAEHGDDMAAYTEAKFEVVRSLTREAREAGYEDRVVFR